MRLNLVIALGAFSSLAFGAYPSGFSEVPFVTGLSSPTAMAFAPDGRLFVCQQGGALRVVKNGVLLSTPFLTVSVDSNGERGLLGVAFHPNFASNNFVYIYYTVPTDPIHNRVSRVMANGDVMLPGSEVPILDLDNLSGATNHNGGAIHFGPDSKLYVAVGDNASSANAQSLLTRLGKILRINDDGSFPSDNPFFATATGLNPSIWSLGLRNPYTFSFHPTNGRMHINDVGENTWEEVDLGIAGANYGWPTYEGFDGGNPNFADPLVAYNHNAGTPTGCAITGGAFYAGVKYPIEYADTYFYSDFCEQFIYRLSPPNYDTQIPFATALGKSAVDLQVFNGELYFLTRNAGGSVYVVTTPLSTWRTTKVGIWRPNTYNMVAEDVNGNIAWDPGVDQPNFFGATGDTVIFGDWDGSGKTKMGIFRLAGIAAMFALDVDGDGAWNPLVDRVGFFGFAQPNDVPIVGDWTGDGKSKIGIYRPASGFFTLDLNNNLTIDSGIDRFGQFGTGGDTPIIGDWTGNGISRVGTFKDGLWSLDVDNTLTISAGDSFGVIGQTGDTPLLGDWNGDGKTKVGVYRSNGGVFGLDYNGNLTWDDQDKGGVFGPGGAGIIPLVGDWDGTGVTRVGIFDNSIWGIWSLDMNGNIAWDPGTDTWGAFGAAGDTPVVGKW